MRYFFFIITVAFSLSGCAQIVVTSEMVAIDDSLQIALIQIPKRLSLNKQLNINLPNQEPSVLLLTAVDSVYTAVHTYVQGNKKYRAYVTSLPLMQINAPNGIVNEPKRLAQISYAYKDTTITSYAGIELRGSSSIVFPKKTYDINFYKDSTGLKNQDLKLAGMRSDDDWILDGLYNEPLRLRSFLSLNLWNEIHVPYYLDREPKAKAGATGRYAEVFVNGHYQGVFLLHEQVDRKLLKVKKIQGDIVRGEIFQGARYHGASTFDSLPPKKNYLASWGGYDIKYPKPTNTYWDRVYPFTDFVINSDDTAFAKGIEDKFVINNAIDYFLFVNALRATDNLGKNLYLVRYDQQEPYFYAPWDLDGTFGTIFSGKRIKTTDDFLVNGLLKRLIATDAANFVARFQNRWVALRSDILSNEKLLKKQRDTYDTLLKNKVYEREALAWGNFIYDAEGLSYMHNWTEQRLAFLDERIAQLKD